MSECACDDNSHLQNNPPNPPSGGYANMKYYIPSPGRYYIQMATVGDVNRGQMKVRVYEPPVVPTPALSAWRIVLLLALMGGAGMFAMRRMKSRATT